MMSHGEWEQVEGAWGSDKPLTIGNLVLLCTPRSVEEGQFAIQRLEQWAQSTGQCLELIHQCQWTPEGGLPHLFSRLWMYMHGVQGLWEQATALHWAGVHRAGCCACFPWRCVPWEEVHGTTLVQDMMSWSTYSGIFGKRHDGRCIGRFGSAGVEI